MASESISYQNFILFTRLIYFTCLSYFNQIQTSKTQLSYACRRTFLPPNRKKKNEFCNFGFIINLLSKSSSFSFIPSTSHMLIYSSHNQNPIYFSPHSSINSLIFSLLFIQSFSIILCFAFFLLKMATYNCFLCPPENEYVFQNANALVENQTVYLPRPPSGRNTIEEWGNQWCS